MQNNTNWGMPDNSGFGLNYDFIGGTVSDFGIPDQSNMGYQKQQYGAQNYQIGGNYMQMGGVPAMG
jgi:hypothetical protein